MIFIERDLRDGFIAYKVLKVISPGV